LLPDVPKSLGPSREGGFAEGALHFGHVVSRVAHQIGMVVYLQFNIHFRFKIINLRYNKR
jgi:hypothetical protein